jgi:arsenical pump membrane protein
MERSGTNTLRATRGSWGLAVVGLVGLGVAFATRSTAAQAAASQVWPPFVLVTGLLLIGLVADDDGVFLYSGQRLAMLSTNGFMLFTGATVLVGVVTAVLNLDTSVAFLTPVLVYTARSRGGGEAPLLYGCLLLSNAGSLFLPGSNLTNLIVLGHLRLTGAQFFSDMWAPAVAALLVTSLVIGTAERRSLRLRVAIRDVPERPVLGLGLLAIVLAVGLILSTSSPALGVAAIGVSAVALRIVQRKNNVGHVTEVLGAPLLAGLFGIAVAFGTLGRVWYGPAHLLSHLNAWGTAGVAALLSVAVNNLPAASLLAARTPTHPFSLLVGLNLGPNLLVSGSLAWMLWLRVARRAGATPSLRKASRLGVIAVPLSMVAAMAILALRGLS